MPILLIFITDRCNLRCRMCGVWEHANPETTQDELSTDEWKAVIRSAARLHTTLLSITGGEAILRPDVFDLIRCARENNIAVHLCSNGVSLNERNVDLIRESGLSTISISLESTVPEIHEKLRGAGTFEKTVAGIRLVRERSPATRVGINFLITPLNFRGMADMIPFAESLGVHQIKFAPIHRNLQHKGKRFDEFPDLVFREEDLDDLDVEVTKLKEAAARTRLQTTSRAFLEGILDLYRDPGRTFRCYAGFAACAINPRGIVTPCCDVEGGMSVRDMPLEAIWRSSEFHGLRQQVVACERPCWDTTNAELSLRLRARGVFREIRQTWRDLKFYFGSNHG
jgi:Fe-coproporphyrin III synthase